MTETSTTDTIPAPSTYTPGELAYLLAGRTSPSAVRAREIFGLAELHEGDDALLEAVQSLGSRDLVRVDGDSVEISPRAKALGYALGTGTDWVRIAVQADDTVDAIVVVSTPQSPPLVLRMDPLGNYQAIAIKPGVHPSQVVGMLVTGYFANFTTVTASVHRDILEPRSASSLVVEHTATSTDWIITARTGISGQADVTDETITVDEDSYLSSLEALIV